MLVSKKRASFLYRFQALGAYHNNVTKIQWDIYFFLVFFLIRKICLFFLVCLFYAWLCYAFIYLMCRLFKILMKNFSLDFIFLLNSKRIAILAYVYIHKTRTHICTLTKTHMHTHAHVHTSPTPPFPHIPYFQKHTHT